MSNHVIVKNTCLTSIKVYSINKKLNYIHKNADSTLSANIRISLVVSG